MSKEINYAEDIQIDGEALDLEWLNQSSLMFKYGRHSANMQRKLEEAKQELDIARAEADKEIRNDPEKFGLTKTTDSVVANAILNCGDYQEAYSQYMDAKYEADMARAAVNAFEHRKSALENLVRLYGQQYFAGPSVPYQINREWESKEKDQRVSKKISEGLQRRRREE
jgi:exonuclease VII small subunit